jgi:20S proteasome alpha/beta subunit
MYYENKKGALIASDSRATYSDGFTLIESKKIENINQIIVASAGAMYLCEELRENLMNFFSERLVDSKKIRKKIQQEHKKALKSDRKKDIENILDEDYTTISLFGYYINKPEIFELLEESGIESVEGFTTLGAGKEESYAILKDIYKPNFSQEEAIESVAYCINKTSKEEAFIDNNLQVGVIEKDGCKILNYDENENFNFYKFSNVKNKVNRINEQQKKALNILLYGDKETKSKLVKILNEYKNKN